MPSDEVPERPARAETGGFGFSSRTGRSRSRAALYDRRAQPAEIPTYDRGLPRADRLGSGHGRELETYEGAATIEKVASLCRRRAFVFPSSDIYGGLGS